MTSKVDHGHNDRKSEFCTVCKAIGRKQIDVVGKCQFCGENFCNEHIAPSKFITTEVRNRGLIKYFQPFAGHHCSDYDSSESAIPKEKTELIQSYDSDIIWDYSGGVPIPIGRKSEKKPIKEEPIERKEPKAEPKHEPVIEPTLPRKDYKKLGFAVFVILIIIGIVYLLIPITTVKNIPYVLNSPEKIVYLPYEYQWKIDESLIGNPIKEKLNGGWKIEYQDIPALSIASQKITVEMTTTLWNQLSENSGSWSRIFSLQSFNCTDGTFYNQCSNNQPHYCFNGTLVKNSTVCGCPYDYRVKGNDCELIPRCTDRTVYGECSNNKPFYCSDGILIDNPLKCGCLGDYYIKLIGDKCVDLRKPDVSYLERKIHDLINVERQKNGLAALSWNDKIALATREHSEDMMTRNYFQHDSPEGHDFTWRYAQAGFTCSIVIGNTIYMGAENIHQGWTYGMIYYTNDVETSRDYLYPDQIAQQAVTGWMNSPGHRQNILTSYWQSEGIGVAIANNGKVYATEDFC